MRMSEVAREGDGAGVPNRSQRGFAQIGARLDPAQLRRGRSPGRSGRGAGGQSPSKGPPWLMDTETFGSDQASIKTGYTEDVQCFGCSTGSGGCIGWPPDCVGL